MSQRGWTLVELTVVVAILAVLAVVAVPLVRTATLDFRLAVGARQLVSDVRTGRQQAMTRSETWQVNLDLATGSYQAVGPGGNQISGTLPQGISFDAGGTDLVSFSIHPDGSFSAGGTIRLVTDRGQVAELQVEAYTGYIGRKSD
ncbi:MAG: GspH/FimT family pseudopilin [Bacillota bacterium]